MEKTNKKRLWITLLCAGALLILVTLLENVLDPSKNVMLFISLKKGAVYALVAVSMNLLNGFTGLFSLGQAGFMLLGAYTYAILTFPPISGTPFTIFTTVPPSTSPCRSSWAEAPWGWCWGCSWL